MRTKLAARTILALGLIAGPVLSGFSAPQVSAVNNGKIVFDSNRDHASYEIYSVNFDGSGLTRLTNNTVGDVVPSISPSGHKIAFRSNRDGNNEIYIMNADGTGQTRLTNNAVEDSFPQFSPDGTKLLFLTSRDGNNELYTMNIDGTSQNRLTAWDSGGGPDENIQNFEWSPDGSKVAYVRGAISDSAEIFTINANGTGDTRLTNNAFTDTRAHFSPDGTKILFETNRDGNNEVYVMSSNGTGVTNLTNSFASDRDPSWSPMGNTITFDSDRTGDNEIYTMNADGTGLFKVTNNTEYDYGPRYSPDGSFIVFGRYTLAPYSEKIYRINLDGTGEATLGSMPDGTENYYYGGLMTDLLDSSSTIIQASLASVISISTSGTVAISLTPSGGSKMSSNSDTVSVSTNNSTGYALSLSNQDTTTTLANGGNTIAAHNGTLGSPTNLTANTWGFRVDSVGGFGAGPTSTETNANSSAYSWAGVPSSAAPVQLKSTGSTASNDATTVWYGVMVDSSTPNGVYSDTVTYTAVTN